VLVPPRQWRKRDQTYRQYKSDEADSTDFHGVDQPADDLRGGPAYQRDSHNKRPPEAVWILGERQAGQGPITSGVTMRQIRRMMRAGLPAAKQFAGTSRVTTLPAPIALLCPIETPGRMIV
jgi:hypothetical protein